MRFTVIAAIGIVIAIVYFTACSPPATPKDMLVNVLTSQPGSVTLTTSDKIRLARFVVNQLQSLTNSTPRKK